MDGVGAAAAGDAGVHRALAVPARRALLAELTSATGPLEAQQLAETLGLHPTTIRHHLTALVQAGLVTVSRQPGTGRGRPKLRYTAAPARQQLDAYRELVEILAHGYGRLGATQAGRDWGAGQPPDDAPLADRIRAAAERWGFRPEPGPDGELLLRDCPFLRTAERHPEVICAVHQGLLDALADGRDIVRLHPFSAPGVCTVTIGPVSG
ncbi:helix-turn-helix domain-containing protein [Kitasatospora sp. NBC_00070]|uniref:helix-turn-helix transcriptional regulator n=1 Tax=Kitasatospora sp. NBC_00070 TaxID=2975962 RepID=UPI00324B204C